MKKRIVLTIIFIAFISISNSFADPIPISSGQLVTLSWPTNHGSTNGGLFSLVGPSNSYSFFTFCIEKDEYINFSNQFYVDSISTTVFGGGNDADNGVPLSSGAAYLYSQYIMNAVFNNSTLNDNYQNAIWAYENEILVSSLSIAAKDLYDSASSASGLYGVYAVNLKWDGPNGANAQTMLVKDPVPEPVSMLLFGTGLVGIGGFIRKKFKK